MSSLIPWTTVRRICLILATSAGLGGVAATTAQADVIMSPTGNTFCSYAPGTRPIEVMCTAADFNAGGGARKLFVLRSTGRARQVSIVGDPGDGTFTARYGQWLYFTGGSARLEGSRRDLRCIFRRSGLRCVNRSGHGFLLRLGLHRRF